MQLVQTRVGRVAVEMRGDGPPLVLLHSVAHSHHDYADVVPTLARTFRTIAVDWPGHGASEMWAPPASASVGATCEALEDLVDALDLPAALFVGNSIGGAASLRLAATRPERVRALVLVGSGGLTGSSALLRAFCWVQGRELVRRWTGMAFARWYLKRPGPGRDAVLTRLAAQRRRPGFVQMDAAMWRSFGAIEHDLTALASAVRCPTLLVGGKYDPVIRPQIEGMRMRALLGHARYVELETGHVPFVEDPAAFLDAVQPFLSSVRG